MLNSLVLKYKKSSCEVNTCLGTVNNYGTKYLLFFVPNQDGALIVPLTIEIKKEDEVTKQRDEVKKWDEVTIEGEVAHQEKQENEV